MAGYPGLGRVTDPAIYAVGKQLFDLVQQLQRRIDALEAQVLQGAGAYAAQGQRITNLGDPQAAQDAVTVSYLRAYVGAQVGGQPGASGTIDTTTAQTITVERGRITEIV